MSTFSCLVRFLSGSGQVRYRLGDWLADRYLECVAEFVAVLPEVVTLIAPAGAVMAGQMAVRRPSWRRLLAGCCHQLPCGRDRRVLGRPSKSFVSARVSPLTASGPGRYERRDLLLDAILAAQQEMPPAVDRHQLRSPDPSRGLGGIAEC